MSARERRAKTKRRGKLSSTSRNVALTAAIAVGIAGQGSASADEVSFLGDIYPSGNGGYPASTLSTDSRLYFSAYDDEHGRELWVSDGTTAGTSLVKDINPGGGDSYPRSLTSIDGMVYFSAYDEIHGDELWKSDGTAAGTTLVKDIRPGNGDSSYLGEFANVGGTLYFSANDGVHDSELWRSDGTEQGTMLVKDLDPDSYGGGYPSEITSLNGALYFIGTGGDLWTSDGTAAGTTMVEELQVENLTRVGDQLFFAASTDHGGIELWVSDGTAAGTTLVKDINSGLYDGSYPDLLTEVDGVLYFAAVDDQYGDSLWKSTGTSAGTTLVKDFDPTSYYTRISSIVNVAGTLYVAADDGLHGDELWVSDGTGVGTTLVKDIRPGGASGLEVFFDSFKLEAVEGEVYFAADDGDHGLELWKSDGTSSGTRLVVDSMPGPENGAPGDLNEVGGSLIFSANHPAHGRTLWRAIPSDRDPDSTPPDTGIDSGPADGSTIGTDSATFSFHGTPGDTARLQCSLDGEDFADCTSPKTFSGLGDGSHTVSFRAVDAAGNVDPTPASRTFTVDTTVDRPSDPPSTELSIPKSGKANTKKGTLKLKVKLPAPGTLKASPSTKSGKKPPKSKQLVKTTKTKSSKAGKVAITIKPSQKGKAKLRKSARKSKIGKLKAWVKLTFTPRQGESSSAVRKYTLKLKSKKRKKRS